MKLSNRVKSFCYATLTSLSFSNLSHILEESPKEASIVIGNHLPTDFTSGWGALYAMFFVLLYFFYRHFRFSGAAPAQHRACRVLAVFFGFFMVIGSNLRFNNSLNFFTHSPLRFLFSLVMVAGFAIFFHALLEKLLQCCINIVPAAPRRMDSLIFEAHPFLLPFLIILCCYLPYIIAFFPGTVHWDALWQLNQFDGAWTWTTHHPPFPTMLMGFCLRLGQYFGNDNLGVFFYTLPQALLAVTLFASAFPFFKELRVPYLLRWAALAFFALFPLCPIFAVTLTKDTGFSLALFAFALLTFRLFLLPNTFSLRRMIFLGASALLVCLFRNNGIHQIFLCAFGLLLCIPPFRKRLGLLFAGVLGLFLVFSSLLVPALGIQPGSSSEAFSIPLQQSARLFLTQPEAISEEEYVILNRFIDLSQLPNYYLPEKSDGVKSIVRSTADAAAQRDYLTLWLRQSLRHPLTTIEATLNNTYGYFYPDRTPALDGMGYYSIESTEGVNLGQWDFHFLPIFEKLRTRLTQLPFLLQKLPLLGMLYSCGAHAWVLLAVLCFLYVARQKRLLWAFMPAVSTLLVCFASPVNAYIRYLLPVMLLLPITLAVGFMGLRQDARQ